MLMLMLQLKLMRFNKKSGFKINHRKLDQIMSHGFAAKEFHDEEDESILNTINNVSVVKFFSIKMVTKIVLFRKHYVFNSVEEVGNVVCCVCVLLTCDVFIVINCTVENGQICC